MAERAPVRHLLIACLEGADRLCELEPALQVLRLGLPGAHLALLAPATAPGAALPQAGEILKWPASLDDAGLLSLVGELRRRRFDAAVILSRPGTSPYLAAYTCYLAGVPLRLGQSCEFGGAVLSHRFPPLAGRGPARAEYLALAGRALEKLAPGGGIETRKTCDVCAS